MAQHVMVAVIKDKMVVSLEPHKDNSYFKQAYKSILRIFKFVTNPCRSWYFRGVDYQRDTLWGKKFMQLPQEYAFEYKNYKPFYIGDYFLGKRKIFGGTAGFEIHISPDKTYAIIYLVA